jgi:hypothetical protein
MDAFLGGLFCVAGVLGVFCPGIFYQSAKLSNDQILRNKRICNRVGAALILLGILDLVFTFSQK